VSNPYAIMVWLLEHPLDVLQVIRAAYLLQITADRPEAPMHRGAWLALQQVLGGVPDEVRLGELGREARQ
jgi:hypothetical protein